MLTTLSKIVWKKCTIAPPFTQNQGKPLYYLLFATDNDAGRKIMNANFNAVTQPYQQSFGFERPKLLDD